MSKKSRQRNKKILAAIGIGLGAAAMASKRKSDLAGTEDGKSGSTSRPSIADVSGPVKKKSVDTGTGRDFEKSSPKYEPKKDTTSIAKQSSRGAGNYPDYKKAETRVDGTLIKGRSNAQRITPFSPAQGNRAKTTEEMLRNSDTRGYKSGGRAGYKHGGSTGSSKSSGAAKRGISPILMKGRK
jgi:hypothetical protein